jgi:hypothetical protein
MTVVLMLAKRSIWAAPRKPTSIRPPWSHPGDTTTTKDEVWMVEAVDEMLTVSAGTFLTLRVRKTTSGNADNTYWFAKGVGKVQEMGEQVETLTSYLIP